MHQKSNHKKHYASLQSGLTYLYTEHKHMQQNRPQQWLYGDSARVRQTDETALQADEARKYTIYIRSANRNTVHQEST